MNTSDSIGIPPSLKCLTIPKYDAISFSDYGHKNPGDGSRVYVQQHGASNVSGGKSGNGWNQGGKEYGRNGPSSQPVCIV